MGKYTMFMDWKNHYSENEYTTQSNLQIHCNPYQATNDIFHRTKTNNVTICMEIQKTSKAKAILRKKNGTGESTCLTSDSTTKLQQSKQYDTDIKRDTKMNGKI